jgi:2-amino-4-hydroxy-6-hydroxymethyldihydropteridine diphosphokinase
MCDSKSSVQAYIGIGSNLANPIAQVRQAFQALVCVPRTRCVARSPLYRSAPLGPQGQPDYINAVAALTTRLAPETLLRALQDIEQAHGRVRTLRWGPRTLDLDILLYGDLVQTLPHLVIPHPRLQERAFVLYPLQDIAPALVIPGLGDIAVLVQRCPPLPLERLVR